MSDPIEGTATEVPKQQLTVVPVYTQTARDLAQLEHELQSLVVDTSTKKGLKEAKAIVSRLVKCRTTLEKVRKEANADLIKAKSLNDDEAKRIAARIVALEEPIKLQVEKKEAEEAAKLAELAEAARLRVEKLTDAIQSIRDTPASVQGQPSVIIQGALKRVSGTEFSEDEFAEYYHQALDAKDAVVGRLTTMLHDQKQHEAEQEQIKRDREELERARAENERLQQEADKRSEADRVEADRLAQVERDRLAAIERGKAMEAAAAERERIAAERAEQEKSLQAERDRLAAQQELLADVAAAMAKEKREAASEAERVRLAGLGLREAAQAVVEWFMGSSEEPPLCVHDLATALANDATDAKPARAKRAKG